MGNEQYRERRYGLHARIELTDLKSDQHAIGQTRNISEYGCALMTADALQARSRVRLTISYGGHDFMAVGRIVYVNPDCMIGIAFSEIDPRNQTILDGWITAFRKTIRRSL